MQTICGYNSVKTSGAEERSYFPSMTCLQLSSLCTSEKASRRLGSGLVPKILHLTSNLVERLIIHQELEDALSFNNLFEICLVF